MKEQRMWATWSYASSRRGKFQLDIDGSLPLFRTRRLALERFTTVSWPTEIVRVTVREVKPKRKVR